MEHQTDPIYTRMDQTKKCTNSATTQESKTKHHRLEKKKSSKQKN